MEDLFSIYIHFPYCRSRCPYCDFFRALRPKDFDEQKLVNRYIKDLEYFEPYVSGRKVKSVFFGGGTPSLLTPFAVRDILHEISSRFEVLPEAEISLEANPNSVDSDCFERFREAGINRLSLGVQALNEKDLKFLGRTHTLQEALNAMETGVKIFPKFSIDLIYARSGQEMSQWKQEIDLALSYGVKHISLYQLTIEEGTVFARKNIKGMDEEKAADFYEATVQYLRERGFERYEVSNFAVKGNECVHNMVYWQGGDYIGLGDYAHGRLKKDNECLASVNGKIMEILLPEERAEELLLMGLRIKQGINAKAFYEACGIQLFGFVNNEVMMSLARQGLLEYGSEGIRLTDAGFLLLDEIVRQLLP